MHTLGEHANPAQKKPYQTIWDSNPGCEATVSPIVKFKYGEEAKNNQNTNKQKQILHLNECLYTKGRRIIFLAKINKIIIK